MITRIRYKSTKTHMTNITPLLAQTKMITVGIDLLNMSYVIFNDEDKPITSGKSSSKQKVLSEVKAKVKELGVLFHDEIRPRKVKKTKVLTETIEELIESEDKNVSISDTSTYKILGTNFSSRSSRSSSGSST